MEMRANEIHPEPPRKPTEDELKAKFPFLGDDDDFAPDRMTTEKLSAHVGNETALPGLYDNDTFIKDEGEGVAREVPLGPRAIMETYFVRHRAMLEVTAKDLCAQVDSGERSVEDLFMMRAALIAEYREFEATVAKAFPEHSRVALPPLSVVLESPATTRHAIMEDVEHQFFLSGGTMGRGVAGRFHMFVDQLLSLENALNSLESAEEKTTQEAA